MYASEKERNRAGNLRIQGEDDIVRLPAAGVYTYSKVISGIAARNRGSVYTVFTLSVACVFPVSLCVVFPSSERELSRNDARIRALR